MLGFSPQMAVQGQCSRSQRSFAAGSSAALCAAVLALGCSSKDRPPVFESPEADAGGTHLLPGQFDAGAEEAAADDAGSDPVSTTDPGGGTSGGGSFDPNQVYVIALVRSIQNLGIAPVADPESYTAGIYDSPTNHYGIRSGNLLYGPPNQPVYRFVPDPNASSDSALLGANDVLVDTLPCSNGPNDFLVGPSGRLIYLCADFGGWYEDGKLLYAGTLLALGNGDSALGKNGNITLVTLNDGVEHQSQLASALTWRAAADGFDLVLSVKNGLELDHLDVTGAAQKLDTFPALPAAYFGLSAVLGPNHVLFQIAQNNEDFVIFQRPLTAPPTVIYTQKINSYLVLSPPTAPGPGLLISGP